MGFLKQTGTNLVSHTQRSRIFTGDAEAGLVYNLA